MVQYTLNNEELEKLIYYQTNYCHLNNNFLNKAVSGDKIFLDKKDFNGNINYRLKPLKTFITNFCDYILDESSVSFSVNFWGENEKSYFHSIEDITKFKAEIKKFFGIVLVNDLLDLTICTNHYFKEYKNGEFSAIGNLLHQVKIENKSEANEKLMSEIKNIVNNFNFNIYGSNLVIIPMYSSTNIVLETARLIQVKTQIDIIDDAINIVETIGRKKIKNLEKKIDRYNALNGNVIFESSKIPKGKNILLVDDNYQSGSTLNYIGTILKSYYNIEHVYGFCITKTQANLNV
ncbi:MAG: hypothetical protein V2B14_05050 [bacterium]